MRPFLPALTAMAAILLMAGCNQKPPIYRWGVYEPLLYHMYNKPGKADPGAQVARLSEDIERTHAEGKRIPPGVYAHLGYMYYLQGSPGEAQAAFETERKLFPESAVFIDGILKRLRQE